MSDQDISPNKYSELRSICKYDIDLYNVLYQLKTENEEDLNKIYKMIKTELIESKKHHPENILKGILNIIPWNNLYTMSYFYLAKLICDDYHVTDIVYVNTMRQNGIELDKFNDFEKIKSENLKIHRENTIYRAIMYNDLKTFIVFTERKDFDENQVLYSSFYPNPEDFFYQLSFLELCCYHGAVDCFKFLRTKFNSKITKRSLEFSFLGGNPEIMSECLKYQKPNKECMKYAIISHNIDFVTFLMNEYNIEIDLNHCAQYHNLESFLVYFDQTNDFNKCFIYSSIFDIPSLFEYFLSHCSNINEKDKCGRTALHYAALNNCKEIAELLISNGANINEKDNDGKTALHYAAKYNSKEIVELLISHDINIKEKDEKRSLLCSSNP
ncbi:hypothetical protein TVAG_292000 [Trichomonas vaginalis G3]|uniref:DUF3447 domain-containing protein n=1 Tax=Trichomonas vaginalis (strain ATCC PRA-98 / G3) TaxID=412133 RepID=A2DQY0_TRIV3|nr:proteasome regulatory particle assembly [Trichomonas vaginalis G3]EAY17247.1 hypothetical protein TVAG_292000 [Trichomonas vaginalis G3]KAI5486221.1 proteasome regulatory particle assembly [Trichomonas vaginalis G3]|eukprot:XP_001329470.1 hypothetical protein [Trichomonas vaginalis G3]